MAIHLPRIIADYFEADLEKDGEAVARCFSEDAVVRDEGHTHVGREAIGRWKADSSTRYSYTAEPFALAIDGDRTVVTSHLVGDFPGSPLDLRYVFTLADGEIAGLEIMP